MEILERPAKDGTVRIAWQSSGKRTELAPLLFSHGYSATAAMWQPQIEALGTERRLISWDMRGHGASASPEDPSLYSEQATVADMLALLDENRIERAVLVGLSLGGYMSLAFHRAHPERVAGLVLLDTGPGFKNDEARAKWNDYALATARRFEEQGLAALPKRNEVGVSRHTAADGLAKAARGMLTQRDAAVISSLPDIRVPTLLLVGADDEGFLAGMSYMNKKIPDSRHVVIPDAGHAANLDQPERVNREIAAFLADHDL